MNTQDNSNVVTVSVIDSFQSYAVDSKMMGELKTRLEDTRKILEPVIRAHKIPVGDNKAWKEKREIFYPLVKELEWPTIDEDVVQDERLKAEKRKAEARVVAWLGVIRTCLEYQILPTDKNADRLRKAKVWTGINGNGKLNPNWVDPNAQKIEATPATTATPTATAPTATAPTASQAQTTPKVPPVSAATPQKVEDKVHPLTSNVSSSDEPLSAREHFKIIFNQLTKNETFRDEYCSILALMLDVEKATLTRCMIQANDEVKV